VTGLCKPVRSRAYSLPSYKKRKKCDTEGKMKRVQIISNQNQEGGYEKRKLGSNAERIEI
jgi:hypothetical protein